jgi:hypothetical protein
MDYHALLSSSLLSIGLDPELVVQIEDGAEIYGDAGLLDSVYLVGLIAAMEEALARAFDAPVDLFAERGVGLLDEFKDAKNLVSFLRRRVPRCTVTESSVEDW